MKSLAINAFTTSKMMIPKSLKITFGKYEITEIKAELTRISYVKNFHHEHFISDNSTYFHFYILLYLYAVDEDGDDEYLANYTQMMNEDMEIVDDFLTS
ncbi:hypothetical protein [Algicola sagamiensis]|uniref:hypothetical protein n=1 Tax=Algicola sagamiensis TaxID=163869 RepID=UPI00146AC8A4|nr:hypothetical protein [Algicola sagamiensis]